MTVVAIMAGVALAVFCAALADDSAPSPVGWFFIFLVAEMCGAVLTEVQ